MDRDLYYCEVCHIYVLRDPDWPHHVAQEIMNGTWKRDLESRMANFTEDMNRLAQYVLGDSRGAFKDAIRLEAFLRITSGPLKIAEERVEITFTRDIQHRFIHEGMKPEWRDRYAGDLMREIIKEELKSFPFPDKT